MLELEITKLKTLVCMVVPELEAQLLGILHDNHAMCFSSLSANGISRSQVKTMLGLADNPRNVVIAWVREQEVAALMDALREHIYNKPGNGVALTTRIDAFIGAKTTFNYTELEIMEEQKNAE